MSTTTTTKSAQEGNLPPEKKTEKRMTSNKLINISLVLIALAPCVYFGYEKLLNSVVIQVSIVVSMIALILTIKLVPSVAELTAKAGLAGKDLNKGEEGEKQRIPESLGLVPGIVYIICVCLLQLLLANYKGTGSEEMVSYNAALFTSCFMLFLGFVDDVLELRWRYKLILPTLATLPLLMAYNGLTSVVVPKPFRALIGIKIVELGVLYKVYMLLVAVYCSNTINILAGINGLEAGQAFIIACSILIHNFIELGSPYHAQHMFSIVCMLPFIATTLGLLRYNWYPSRVFVGDTFTYFAGMTLAVVGILGHFSKTLMLFFIPQWINFLISLPQLVLPWIECPRHRIPKYDPKTKKLKSSRNYTLLNLILEITGPMTERNLAIVTLSFQVLCSVFAFWIRYRLSTYFYDE